MLYVENMLRFKEDVRVTFNLLIQLRRNEGLILTYWHQNLGFTPWTTLQRLSVCVYTFYRPSVLHKCH